ncbi:MAG: WecB/TagA/CpsF family glycosyltransferase [Flavobacteriales bacterium]|nr:WecB/TagA/CpsF family glycosyltransferase [Flavobacteriales bacterium]
MTEATVQPGKLPVLSLSISHAPFAEQVRRIIDLGRAHRSAYVCCVNAHMTVEARDPGFAQVVNGADLATPDGMPVLFAMRWFHRIAQERVAGNDLLPALLEGTSESGISVFLFGGTADVQARIMERAVNEWPRIQFAGAYAPPFIPLEEFDLEQEAARINETGAGIVLVSLGCPKQERFMAAMKGRVHGVMLGLGGAFLLYAGVDKRAPRWMRSLALEWLYRLWLEPRRLFRRYLVTNTIFIGLFVRDVFRPPEKRAARTKGNGVIN